MHILGGSFALGRSMSESHCSLQETHTIGTSTTPRGFARPQRTGPWALLLYWAALVLTPHTTTLAQQRLDSQVKPSTVGGDDKEDGFHPHFRLAGDLSLYLGQGTFISDPYVRNPYFAWQLTALPSYHPHPDWTLRAYLSLIQEVTNTDPIGAGLSDSELVPEQRQLILSDLQLAGRYQIGKIPVVDIQTAVEGRVVLPTSRASRFRTLVTAGQLRLLLSRSFGPISLALTSGFRKNFHRYETGTASTDMALYRTASNELVDTGLVALGQQNVSFSVLNQLEFTYQPFTALSFGITYALLNRFGYRDYEQDDLTSSNANTGRGRVDISAGSVFASYAILPQLLVTLGYSLTTLPKSLDNSRFRFPFFDFESSADNAGSLFLSLSGSQPFGE